MINVEVQEKLGPALSRIASGLDGADRVRVSQAMGAEVRQLIVTHLTGLAETRHTTAERLGGTPTGFIGNLAENFDQSSNVSVDQDGVSISMHHPTLVRAVRDVTITASRQYLTIPLNGLAYGHRIGEFEGQAVQKIFAGGHRTGKEQPRTERSDEERGVRQDIPAFLFIHSVTQKKDPTLLPTMDEINTAAARGAGREIKTILTEAGRLN